MPPIRVGIIGCGRIAFSKHMPSLSKINDVELAAFCHPHREVAQKARDQFGCPDARVFDNCQELLKDSTVDVVHVCTPNDSHADITVDALKAGKHVMCEKPMARTASEAQKMVEAAIEANRKLTVSFNNRYRNDSQYLFNLCRKGELGKIYHAKAHAIRRRGVPTWGHFLDADAQGGGPLIDIGTHAIDLTMWLMDNYDPKVVMGVTHNQIGRMGSVANPFGNWDGNRFESEDSAFGLIVMKNGASIMVESSWALNTLDPIEAKSTLFGTLAGADMYNGLRINGEKDGKLYATTIELDGVGVNFNDAMTQDLPQDLQMKRWIQSIMNDTEPDVSPHQAYVVTQIVEALYRSASTGEPVYFNEPMG